MFHSYIMEFINVKEENLTSKPKTALKWSTLSNLCREYVECENIPQFEHHHAITQF